MPKPWLQSFLCQNPQCSPDQCSEFIKHQLIHATLNNTNATSTADLSSLIHTNAYLGIKLKDIKKPCYIDFITGTLAYRAAQAGLKKEAIASAPGVKPAEKVCIVDVTAGLGRDSFLLASMAFTLPLSD